MQVLDAPRLLKRLAKVVGVLLIVAAAMASGAALYAWLGPQDVATPTETPRLDRELCNDALSRRRNLDAARDGKIGEVFAGVSRQELEARAQSPNPQDYSLTLIVNSYLALLDDIEWYCGG